MVNVNLVAAKLAELEDRCARVAAHCPAEAAGFDRDSLDLVSFNLLLCVQLCSDLAGHLIADEGWPAVTEVRGAFERLEQHGVLTAATRKAMARAVGLRNLVAHSYGVIDPVQVHAAATHGLADLQGFSREVATWVARR